MPQIGKPYNPQENARRQQFRNVGIAAAPSRGPSQTNREIADRERERLLNKVTGYKPKNDLVVDGKQHNKLGKDEFLKLLSAQLKNQDPLDPMKQDKMAAELAQFSQLEQLTNLNKKFDQFGRNDAVEDKFYGASFLGKEVVTTGSTLKHAGPGTQSDVLFALPKPASKVLVRIFDSNNNMVGEVWKENIGRGNQTFTWDGYQMDQSEATAGDYKTQVFAWDEFSEPMEVKTKNTGVVESVFFENGETVLQVDGKKVFLRDVDSFHVPGSRGAPEVNNQEALKQALRPKGPTLDQVTPKGQELQANNAPTNLPIASNKQAKVNLNRNEKFKAYESEPTTGITSVYDE
ncbi:MAG: flagellar hook assembly protein FlgD [Bdellovibrionota bacterium]|nr:flagellar hook assembly protein FlgD [Bdellovibrionota bacterium]